MGILPAKMVDLPAKMVDLPTKMVISPAKMVRQPHLIVIYLGVNIQKDVENPMGFRSENDLNHVFRDDEWSMGMYFGAKATRI